MPSMTRGTWLGLAVMCVSASSARADLLRSTLDQPLFEVSHSVDVRIEDGVATFRVKRQFANPGKIADEAGLEIDLPAGAAATGLRIRARERWYDGELMEREKAARLYHELTGLGAYQPKDPALLQWMWADKLYLQVFPVLPGQVSTVEYTLTVPTRYSGGRYWVSYPRTAATPSEEGGEKGLALATPIVTVHPGWGDSLTPILIDGKRAAPDTAVVLTPPVPQPWEDAVGAEPSASYVASAIEVPPSPKTNKTFTAAKVILDIRHTYKSDVRVELLAPSGTHVILFDQKGGGDNNISGTFPVTLPEPTKGAGTWRLIVSDHVGLDNGVVDKWSLVLGDTTVAAADVPVFIPDAPENANDAGLASIAVGAKTSNAIWAARFGRVVASEKHAFGRLEIDAAPELTQLPKKAQLVFAIDSSFSVKEPMIDAQLALIRTYVAHIPDAEVEIIAYRRHATRVFNRFVVGKDLPAAIETARKAGAFSLGNGSALDAALTLGATILADRKGPRRLISTSDELLRTSLTTPQLIATLDKLPKDIVVHVVTPHLDEAADARIEMERDDANGLAPLATKHHGIFVSVDGLPILREKIPSAEKQLLPIVLELVRPTRIEKLVATGFDLDSHVLREGDGVRVLAKNTNKAVATKVSLSGVLWSDPIKKQVAVGDAFSRYAAAFVFGEDEYHDLSDAEQLVVAFMGRAVSPVTSYVAFEPGTRPSTIGIPERGMGAGSGTIGSGRYGTIGGQRKPPDLSALIDTKACVAKHTPAPGWKVQLEVETTRDEIVDVTIKSGPGALASCLAETTWALRLDRRFNLEREHFTVELH
jgi:subtilisin-like proprotein convertase family protein